MADGNYNIGTLDARSTVNDGFFVDLFPIAGLSPVANAAANTRAENNPYRRISIPDMRDLLVNDDALANVLRDANNALPNNDDRFPYRADSDGALRYATLTQMRDAIGLTEATLATLLTNQPVINAPLTNTAGALLFLDDTGVTPSIRKLNAENAASVLGITPTTFLRLTDTPNALGLAGQVLRVNDAGTSLEFGMASGLPTGGTVGQFVRRTADGAEWANAPTSQGGGATTFSALTDTPSSLGNAGQILAVNTSRTALAFINGPAPATTSASGLVELATQAEVNQGSDASRVITPATLRATGDARYFRRTGDPIPITSLNAAVTARLLPTGGSAGQVLTRISGGYAWETPAAATGGATTLLALTDTPVAYAAPGQILQVNAAGDGLEFEAQRTRFVDLTDTPVTLGAAGQYLRVNARRTDLEWVDALGDFSLTGLSGTPSSYGTAGQVLAVNSARNGVQWVDNPTSILALSDTPPVLGNSGQLLAVNVNGTGLAWVDAPTPTVAFTGLTDTPGSLGTAGQFIRVNDGGTGLEFTDAPSGGGGGGGFGPNLLSSNFTITAATGPTLAASSPALPIRLDFTKTYLMTLSVSSFRNTFVVRPGGHRPGEIEQTDLTWSSDNVLYALQFRNGATGNTVVYRAQRGGQVTGVTITEIREIGAASSGGGGNGGGGVSTFIALTDTPTQLGTAGQVARVNSARNALEFYTPPSTILGLSDTPAAYTGQAGQYLRVNAAENAVEFVAAPVASTTFATLTDTPNALGAAGQVPRVNTAGNGLEFYTPVDTDTDTFLGLTDTPSTFGTAGQVARVNSARTALEFYTPASDFADLGDTPNALGAAGQYLRVNSTRSALEFFTPPAANTLLSLSDVPNTFGNPNQILAVAESGDRAVWVDAPEGGGGSANWLGLTDTPDAYTTAHQIPRVNSERTGLEFYTPSFLGLSDTPTQIGTAGQVARVNAGADALEFHTPSILDLTETPSSLGTAGQFLAVNDDGNGVEFVDQPEGSQLLGDNIATLGADSEAGPNTFVYGAPNGVTDARNTATVTIQLTEAVAEGDLLVIEGAVRRSRWQEDNFNAGQRGGQRETHISYYENFTAFTRVQLVGAQTAQGQATGAQAQILAPNGFGVPVYNAPRGNSLNNTFRKGLVRRYTIAQNGMSVTLVAGIQARSSIEPGDFYLIGIRKVQTVRGARGPRGPAGVGAVTSFAELSDTPTQIGTAGQLIQVNDAGNALGFVDQSSIVGDGDSGLTYTDLGVTGSSSPYTLTESVAVGDTLLFVGSASGAAHAYNALVRVVSIGAGVWQAGFLIMQNGTDVRQTQLAFTANTITFRGRQGNYILRGVYRITAARGPQGPRGPAGGLGFGDNLLSASRRASMLGTAAAPISLSSAVAVGDLLKFSFSPSNDNDLSIFENTMTVRQLGPYPSPNENVGPHLVQQGVGGASIPIVFTADGMSFYVPNTENYGGRLVSIQKAFEDSS